MAEQIVETEDNGYTRTDFAELLRIVTTLETEAVIHDTTAELWRKQIYAGDIPDSAALVQKVNDLVTNIRPRSTSNASLEEKVAKSEEILQRLDLDTTNQEWNAASIGIVDRFMNWGAGAFEAAGEAAEDFDVYDAGMELMTFGAYTSEDAKAKRDQAKADMPPDFSDHKTQFIKQLLTDKTISTKQYQELTENFDLTSDEAPLGEILEQLSDWGITDGEVQSTLATSTTAVWRRTNRQKQLELDQAGIDAAEESLLDDDQKLKRLKQFERLEDEYPGRYVFNPDTGYMYNAGSGELVDANGDLVEFDSSGNLPEGYIEGSDYWDKALDAPQPWNEYGVDVDTYYDLYDVVQNPDRYHDGGMARFADGQRFLGGFESNYIVPQDEQMQEDQYQRDRAASIDPMYGGLTENIDRQAVRRPWYDEMDNWALFAGKSPEAVAEDQQWLIEMGAITADDITDGQWGKAEADAMNEMMFIANGQAQKVEDLDFDYWQEHWDDKAGSGASRAKFAAPAYRTLDPARIQLTIEDTVRRSLGRDASSDELADLGTFLSDQHRQSFAADVTAMEAEYDAQTRAIDGERSSAGEVADVDYEARFMQQFNNTNSDELDRWERTQNVSERQQLIGGALNNFMSKLGGGIGGG